MTTHNSHKELCPSVGESGPRKTSPPYSPSEFFKRGMLLLIASVSQACYENYMSFYLFILAYLATLHLRCGMQDLVSWPGIKPGIPALGTQSLGHWTTREVPSSFELTALMEGCIPWEIYQNSMGKPHTQPSENSRTAKRRENVTTFVGIPKL